MRQVRLIKHEKVDGTGSYEVRVSTFFHFEDVASRRLRLEQKTQDEALKAAQTLAQEERDRLNGRD